MKRAATPRRRPAIQITLNRASRLYRLLTILEAGPAARDSLLDRLEIGLRTFYRELDLLKKCGIKVGRRAKTYVLRTTMVEAEARLPFPDPQLSFAEMSELARHPGDAAKRLDEIYRKVVTPPVAKAKNKRKKGEK